MEKVFLNTVEYLRKKSFFIVAERTMKILMPLALIESIFQFLWHSVFSPESLISNIFYFDKWLPNLFFNGAWYLSQGMSQVIFNTFGLFAVYFSAQYTARLYNKDAQMAGVTAMVSLLLCAYKYHEFDQVRFTFNWGFLSFSSFMFALLVGYGVGQIFRLLGPDYHHYPFENARIIEKRAISSMKPMFLIWFLSLLIGISFSLVKVQVFVASLYQYLQDQGQSNSTLIPSLLIFFVILSLSAMGFEHPLESMVNSNTSMGNGNVANLNYALEHGSSWNVPNKYIANSLYQSYGEFGGSGLTLALLIAVLLVVKKNDFSRISRWNFIPTIFGSNRGALIGLPIIINPIFFLPYVFLPIFNMLIADLAIALRMIPTSTYPVLTGTPGPLVSFIATNGNWQALVFSLLLFSADIMIYMRVVKGAVRVYGKTALQNDKEQSYEEDI